MSEQLLVSNLISSLLVKWGGLDTMYAMGISSVVMNKFDKVNADNLTLIQSFLWVNLYYILTICVFLVVYFFRKKVPYWKGRKYSPSVRTLRLYNTTMIWNLMKYMEEEPSFFDNCDMESDNCLYDEWGTEMFFPMDETTIRLKDTLYGVQGWIKVGHVIKEGENKKTKHRYIDVILEMGLTNKDDLLPLQYFNKIKEYHKEKKINSKNLKLTCFKLIPSKDGDIYQIQCPIFDGLKGSEEQRYRENILTYFSPIRDKIWKQVEQVHFRPHEIERMGQTPMLNLLFHGPPGTGKSTFAKRLALALGRHLICINMTDYKDNKKGLYYKLNSPCFGHDKYKSSDVIILLEEFDNTVRYLEQEQNSNKFSFNYNYGPMISAKEEKKKDVEEKNEKEEETKLTLSSGFKLQLHDLLEIFQGPCPTPGSMIMATTNHFEYIQKTLPALVRDGRLTPCYVGYLDWKSFQELVQFYFKKPTTLREVEINIPTSSIIDMAMKHYMEEDGLDRFEDEFSKRLKAC